MAECREPCSKEECSGACDRQADHPGIHKNPTGCGHTWGVRIERRTKKSRNAEVAGVIERTEREERTGPPATGAQLRDVILPRVVAGTAAEYRAMFIREVQNLARSGRQFTSEDVTAVVGQPPTNPNAVGALMNAAAKTGIIERLGDDQALRPNQHATRISLWRGVVPTSTGEVIY